MDELITEKATSRWDLPHDYTTSGDTHVCYCGRRQSNTLHLASTKLVEHASLTTPLQTEKGS